jgi:hypothetical protein
MKKIIMVSSLLLILSCSRQAEKPKLTLGQYNIQANTAKGVVEKILHESDYKRMHGIALAVESSRAVDCISIGEECNVLGQILNKIVNSTSEGPPSEEENVAIYKLVNQLNIEIAKSEEILSQQWKDYINTRAKEEQPK